MLAPLLALALLTASPHPAARIATGLHPCGAVAGAGALWVANDGSGALARVDPKTNRVTRRVRLGVGSCEVASGFGSVWVANYKSASLLRVDMRTYRVRRIPLGGEPFDVLVGGGQLWVTLWGEGVLVDVDPVSSAVVRRIPLGAYPTGLLFRRGSLWVGFGRDATEIARVDPVTGRVDRIEVGVKAPAHFLSTADGIWITADGDALVRVDPDTQHVTATTHFGRTLVQPATAPDGTIWVPDKEIDRIYRVDPESARVIDSFAGGDGAYTALRAFGSMWVTSYAGADVWRFRF